VRNKLPLTISLATFAALTVLGAGIADADSATGLDSGLTVAQAPSVAPLSAAREASCTNEIDDDEDGLVDGADPDCSTPAGPGEVPPAGEAGPSQGPGAGPVQRGATLNAADSVPPGPGGATRNQDLGAPPSGVGIDGAVSAPSATGGDQIQAAGPDGGSAFGGGGSPSAANPTTTIAPFGPAPIGVPNFVIDSFEIPPFLLPIYQACGTEYGIPWEVLAAINKIETAFGTNLSVSSAGAMGWMQFLPSSWETYGVDANGDGKKDPYNPVDAICAAAKYLQASGGQDHLYDAIFSYNHADWYVEEVLLYARNYGKLPADLVGSLTGLTEGAHFPVAADARYADDISTRAALRRATPRQRRAYGSAADVIASSPTRRGINIFSHRGAAIVAVNDGVITKMGESEKLGRYVVLRDAYGNRYTYAELGRIVRKHRRVVMPTGKEKRVPVDSQNIRPRLYGLPGRVESRQRLRARRQVDSAAAAGADGELRTGSKVIAGTVIARMGAGSDGVDPHINFSIRPAGRGAPRIDPKPILDGWKLLEATAIYRAKGKSPFGTKLSAAGALLLPKSALERRVLADRRLSIYDCGRSDIRSGQIDRRVLATLEYLADKGFRLTVTSLKCGHSYFTSSGNISNHSFGTAVDIAVINGVPVLGHQGPGTLTDSVLKAVLQLQGAMAPEELISLETLGGPSFALPDHADHIHIGWQPPVGSSVDSRYSALLGPRQWLRLTNRLDQIDNPDVLDGPHAHPTTRGGNANGPQRGAGASSGGVNAPGERTAPAK
jgi:hypothetical protein